jgi:hypothetical protein
MPLNIATSKFLTVDDENYCHAAHGNYSLLTLPMQMYGYPVEVISAAYSIPNPV